MSVPCYIDCFLLGERTILGAWVIWIKEIIIVSTNTVDKILVEALIYYSNFLKFFLLIVAVFIFSEVVELRKIGRTII